MADRVLVSAEGIEFYAELQETGGPQTIGLDEILSFEGVRHSVAAICKDLARAWDVVKPSEATVEFGLDLTARSGRLTGLLVAGDGQASLRISLTWKNG